MPKKAKTPTSWKPDPSSYEYKPHPDGQPISWEKFQELGARHVAGKILYEWPPELSAAFMRSGPRRERRKKPGEAK